ncbi:MAG: 3-deoxy-D-manno-octulosonic acid transferase [Candidatus Omnitrophica bacterium]|nr:3-deoxy-D-manno-octulosonic acid transferase [Candidatus Omnitrophota bacterium]
MFFDVLFFIYALVYLPYLLLTGRWYKGYGLRFGSFTDALKARLSSASTIWIHAVSVGEVMAVVTLVEEMKSRWPTYTLVVTTTTKTGYQLAQSKLRQTAVVIPSPLDFSFVAASFLRLIKPKVYIAVETEIWPNLFNCLSRHGIPIIIINGRISDVSYGRYKAIKFLLKRVLEKVSLFCMQTDRDVRRMVELGAPQDKVFTVGNIKFDDLPSDSTMSFPSRHGGIIGNPEYTSSRSPTNAFGDDRIWVAGSTHPGEEEIVLDVYGKMIKEHSQWHLIIAPRHVERTAEIVRLVEKKGLSAIKLSDSGWPRQGQDPLLGSSVVVVDTIGHLRSLYARSSLVFVGKSLCVGGGHNIIEPAFYAKPIIIGPHMDNFRDIAALFKTQGALIQVKDSMEFEQQVKRLMTDEFLRTQLGEKAYGVVKANQGAGARILKMLEKWLL